MSIVRLKSPFASYRGATSFPHPDGQVVYPVGNRTFSRAYVHPANPDTPLQVTLRAHLTAISQAWQPVSNANAADWKTLGLAMSPLVDPDGLEYNLLAQHAYTSVNMYRLLDGQAQSAAAPPFSLAAAPKLQDVAYPMPGDELGFTFDAEVAQNCFVLVEISPRTFSLRRTARHNEIFIPDTVPARVFIPLTTGMGGFGCPVANFRFTIAHSQRRGFRLTFVDANYVPGQVISETMTISLYE